MNSRAKKIQGLAKMVRICLGEFEGRTNFLVIEIDDFGVILGNTFLSTTSIAVLPHWEVLWSYIKRVLASCVAIINLPRPKIEP